MQSSHQMVLNPYRAEFVLELYHLFAFTTIWQGWCGTYSWNPSRGKDMSTLYSQYHCCRWPGDARNQSIIGRSIDLVIPVCPGFSTKGPFYEQGLTLIPAWTNNLMLSNLWDEIICLLQNFKGATVEVWKLVKNAYFIPNFIMNVINYPCWD